MSSPIISFEPFQELDSDTGHGLIQINYISLNNNDNLKIVMTLFKPDAAFILA